MTNKTTIDILTILHQIAVELDVLRIKSMNTKHILHISPLTENLLRRVIKDE